MENWPTFLIGGAPRSGTYSIYEYLNLMNTVFMCPTKEPNYFAPSINHAKMLSNPIRDKNEYLKLFKNVKNEKEIGETSPTYLWDPKSPEFIHKTIPNAKIIFILRNPIERSFSHYLNGIGLGYETNSFIDSMNLALNQKNDYSGRIAMASFYSSGIEKYFKYFKKNQLKFFIFEEFFKNTENGIQEILNFLEISENVPKMVNTIHNEFTLPRGKFSSKLITNEKLRSFVKHYLPRNQAKNLRMLMTSKTKKPKISKEEKQFAQKLFFDDIKKTEKLLNRKLSWIN